MSMSWLSCTSLSWNKINKFVSNSVVEVFIQTGRSMDRGGVGEDVSFFLGWDNLSKQITAHSVERTWQYNCQKKPHGTCENQALDRQLELVLQRVQAGDVLRGLVHAEHGVGPTAPVEPLCLPYRRGERRTSRATPRRARRNCPRS